MRVGDRIGDFVVCKEGTPGAEWFQMTAVDPATGWVEAHWGVWVKRISQDSTEGMERARRNASRRPRGEGWNEVNQYGENDNIDIALSEVPYALRRDVAHVDRSHAKLPRNFHEATVLVAWSPDQDYAVIIGGVYQAGVYQIMTIAEGIKSEAQAMARARALVESMTQGHKPPSGIRRRVF